MTNTRKHTNTHTKTSLDEESGPRDFWNSYFTQIEVKVSHPVYSSSPGAQLKLNCKIKSQYFSDSKYYSARYH